MRTLIPTLLVASLFTAGAGFAPMAAASDYEHKGEHYGKHHDGKKCPHHKGQKGHHGHKAWMKDLSDEQKKTIDALHVDYKKQKYALKHKVKDAKVALMKEVTIDKPNQKTIDNKIDAILKIKREKLQLKIAHKIEVRKVLNADQKKQFDEHVMKKATSCRKGKRHH